MRDGFVTVAAITPQVKVADTQFNALQTISLLQAAAAQGVDVAVFPELGLSSYSCGDLFYQEILLRGSLEALQMVVEASGPLDLIAVVGLPLLHDSKLYNCAAVIHKGRILGVVPKSYVSNSEGQQEIRWFAASEKMNQTIIIDGLPIPFGVHLLFGCSSLASLIFAVEICNDVWVPSPPSIYHAAAGATLVLNLSSSPELVEKAEYRRNLVSMHSAQNLLAYVYASSGQGESSTDAVCLAHNMVAENGTLLAESPVGFEGILRSEIDVHYLVSERQKSPLFCNVHDLNYQTIWFDLPLKETPLTRYIAKTPFVPTDETRLSTRCATIVATQTAALAKRLQHIGTQKMVIGVSGGLDSTLALLVSALTCDKLELKRSGILAITMPCFGTTKRTKNNALELGKALGTTVRSIDITKAVLQHFHDIDHDPNLHDSTYENSQARERTQVLMDIANKEGALVVGTGDMSELALGWTTYNGDHMSMYGLNSSIPKTLLRPLIAFAAKQLGLKELEPIIQDILATPVSPELLPPTNGEISQKTESIVGPYELHDFFLYHMLRRGAGPAKLFRLASYAFGNTYDRTELKSWLKVFISRFFSQQFKRSCLPDGPKVGTVALSPRGELRMSSDSSSALWLSEIEQL